MMMEEVEEGVMVSNKDHQTQQLLLLKGKRTKRQRLATTPLTLALASSSSSSADNVEFASLGRFSSTNNTERVVLFDCSTASPTTTSTELNTPNYSLLLQEEIEEEDMANCLILLAQGQSRKTSTTLPIVTTTTTTNNKAQHGSNSSYYLYQCKTCDRCFPSFQALGGHRASHKKLKPNPPEEIKKTLGHHEGHEHYHTTNTNTNTTNTTLSLQISNSVGVPCNPNHKSKVHECLICGAEFSSGQALGGHMRRHRTFMSTPTRTISLATSSPDHDHQSQEAEKKVSTRNGLSLDLNLPATPEDDHIQRESKFTFASKQQQQQVVLAFSASPLVDCHY